VQVRTLGQFLVGEGLLADLAKMVENINARATQNAKALGKQQKLPVVQCFNCVATKTCCHSLVVARLYEGCVVAAYLRDAGRDTPELREQLRTTAEAMEAVNAREWRKPCVFLDSAERCTVYPARPSPCGSLYVYTPPANCSDPTAPVQAYVAYEENGIAQQLEDQFRDKLSLRKKVGRRYIGVLPRMVLVALEAWDRTDFRDYLRQLDWPSESDASRWTGR
jgi:Fe-S-cluster containining protein